MTKTNAGVHKGKKTKEMNKHDDNRAGKQRYVSASHCHLFYFSATLFDDAVIEMLPGFFFFSGFGDWYFFFLGFTFSSFVVFVCLFASFILSP